jgi:hypothetical protein
MLCLDVDENVTVGESSRRMNGNRTLLHGFFLGLLIILVPALVFAMTAQEILEQVAKENFAENFRLIMSVKTFKGKKESASNSIWLMGKVTPELTSFFLDFEEPEESRGLRFLLQIEPGKEPRAYMYLPATGKTLPLAVDDPSVDLGGTGLTMEDMQGFVPESGERMTLVEEQKIRDRDCWVIRVSRAEEKAHRLIWVSKNGFIVVKSQSFDAQGKVTRIFNVVEFFQTKAGREFPREEEITIPGRGIRIVVRQEYASFGVDIPDEIMNPEQFGAFKWRK